MGNRMIRRAAAGAVLTKLMTKAVLERDLIQNGDRILIAASGGKDSTVMAWGLAAIKRMLKREYTLGALHISSDFCACCKKAELARLLEQWGIPFQDHFVPVIGRLKAGEKMNCYWCSTQRRTELLKYAVEQGFNKIALGHHLDDIIETFFMNLTAKGELSAMPILLQYRKYPVSLIRPLAYVEERQIIACAAEQGLGQPVCSCPFGLRSLRGETRRRIAAFTGNSSAIKRRILKALASGPKDLLLE